MDSQTGEYALWAADEFSQRNPQTTDVTGKYAFLVPQGTYYLTVEARGYPDYRGEPFAVREGDSIHENIELPQKQFLLPRAWLIAVAAICLLFLFGWRMLKRRP